MKALYENDLYLHYISFTLSLFFQLLLSISVCKANLKLPWFMNCAIDVTSPSFKKMSNHMYSTMIMTVLR